MRMSFRHELLNKREALVIRLVGEEKLTFAQVGVCLGVTRERVRQMYNAAKARLRDVEENGDDALSWLPTRVRRLVVQLNICSRAMTRSAIESGRLSWNGSFKSIFWDGAMLPKVGGQTWLVLNEWAGLPRPEPRQRYVERAARKRRGDGVT